MTKLKSIKIKGKDYVMVKDRIVAFNEIYPNGRIQTELVSDTDNKIVMKAIVVPDVTKHDRFFTGYSASNPAKMIEKVSPYEVAETSAVGRALAFLGIGIDESIASADEVVKATSNEKPELATPAQMRLLQDMSDGKTLFDVLELINKTLGKNLRDEFEITKAVASETISKLK